MNGISVFWLKSEDLGNKGRKVLTGVHAVLCRAAPGGDDGYSDGGYECIRKVKVVCW